MVKLEFKPTVVAITVDELRKKGNIVIIDKEGEIWTSRPNSYVGVFLNHIFNGVQLRRNILESDKIYIFDSAKDISKTLQDGGCLDKFLLKVDANHENSKVNQLRKWIADYKYVGNLATFARPEKRHAMITDGYIKSYDKYGKIMGDSLEEQFLSNKRGHYNYYDFRGFNDQYEFFTWLNTPAEA